MFIWQPLIGLTKGVASLVNIVPRNMYNDYNEGQHRDNMDKI